MSAERQKSVSAVTECKSFFVGLDSDGSVLDNMERKHKKCFVPNTIECWWLEPVAAEARECVEFVNLYSRTRASNRWHALVAALDMLRRRPEVIAQGVKVPEVNEIRRFIASGENLSNEGLARYIAAQKVTKGTDDPVSESNDEAGKIAELERAQEWSRRIDASIKVEITGLPPFPFVRESLELLRPQAQSAVISQTPHIELEREWTHHGLASLVDVIGGPEFGDKPHQFQHFAGERFATGRMLMVGDAPGDYDAARSVGALFFPIIPGKESASWELFLREGAARFLHEEYRGTFEEQLLDEFDKVLPAVPEWLQEHI